MFERKIPYFTSEVIKNLGNAKHGFTTIDYLNNPNISNTSIHLEDVLKFIKFSTLSLGLELDIII